MMASNLLSRLLPTNSAGRSIYDDLRAHDEASESDIEEQAGMAIDEENLGFHDDELGGADVFTGEDSRLTTESTAFLAGQQQGIRPSPGRQDNRTPRTHSKWLTQSPRLLEEDGDDDVPASLLIEGNNPRPGTPTRPSKSPPKPQRRKPPVPGPSNRESDAHWEAARAQQRLYEEDEAGTRHMTQATRPNIGLLTSNPREKAMWRWINITNLDSFVRDVYDYYLGSGIWCMILARVLNMLLVLYF
jgi:autophagy-related protein 9